MPPDNTVPQAAQPSNKKHLSLVLDLRTLLIVILLVAVGVMLFMWKPWQANIKANERTVSVTGDATITATPDEFVFSSSYDFTNTDKQTALDQLSAKSDDLVAKLKALGVADKNIQTNANDYSSGVYLPVYQDNGNTYTLTLTITVTDKTLAQKVQDYLVTTTPSGAVSPEADFSDAKQKTLQSQARDQATKDARSKADQSAKNLGFKVSAVKSVTDGYGFGVPTPLLNSDASSGATVKAEPASLTLQPGQNDLSYSVTVVYYIK